MKKIQYLVFFAFLLLSPINLIFSQLSDASLEPTFNIVPINNVMVPFQNNYPNNDFPVPSFEKQNRDTISLRGYWKKLRFSPDHNLTLQQRDEDIINTLSNLPVENIVMPWFNDNGWTLTQLPYVENILNFRDSKNGGRVPEIQLDYSAKHWNGGVWYRRHFTVDGDSSNKKLYKLIFYSVNYVCDVWINGQYIGYHEGGYTPFAFNISEALNYDGDNVIAIRVDAIPLFTTDGTSQTQTRYDIVPCSGNLGWFNYGGIIHDMYIEVSEAVSIMRADIVPQGLSGNVQISTVGFNNSNLGKTISISMEIYKANMLLNPETEKASEIIDYPVTSITPISISVAPSSPFARTDLISIPSPELWYPYDPNLYVLKITLKDELGNPIDSFYTQFGIRTVQTYNHRVYLNDKPVFLTGVGRHEDSKQYGRSMPIAKIFDDLKLIKDTLHCNFLRTGHYPNHPFTNLIADRLGLSVSEEIPTWVFTDSEWEIQSNRKIHKQMFNEMVYCGYNRPSIFFWSANNESHDSQDDIFKSEFIQEIKNELNDERILIQSAEGTYYNCEDDQSQELLDAVGWTMWLPGACSKPLDTFLNDCVLEFPDKPIIATEYGGGGNNYTNNEGHLIEISERFKEKFNIFVHRAPMDTLGIFNCSGHVAAISFWIFSDYYSTNVNDFGSGTDPFGHINTWGLYNVLENAYPVKDTLKRYYQYYDSNGGVYSGFIPCAGASDKIISPYSYSLSQNYPNPFNPLTKIKYSVANKDFVKITIYDVLGRIVSILVNEIKEPGIYEAEFNGLNFASGLYLYKMESGNYTSVKKMVLIK